jgi:GT2 family glycosyltransferase
MKQPDVAVVIPSVNRPEQLKRNLEQLLTTAPDAEVVLVLQPEDKASRDVAKEFSVIVADQEPGVGPVAAWNVGAAKTNAKNFVLGADDLWFHDGWYEEALAQMAGVNNYGVVGLNDLSPWEGRLATHYMISRAYAVCEWGGVIVCPHYKHYFLDNEATERARRDERYVWAENAIAEHMHPAWKKAVVDDVYSLGQEQGKDDGAVFQRRMEEGFPNDYPPSFGMLNDSPASGWGKVAVGTRVYKSPEPEFFASWTKMIGNGLRAGDRVFEPVIGQPGHVAANHLARALLASPADSLLLVDDDMVFEPDALEKLRSNPDTQDADVVFGFCTHRTLPPHAVVMKLIDQLPVPVSYLGERYGTMRDIEDNAAIDVDAVGLAFTLIKRKVFEKMLSPHGALYTSWFQWGPHTEGEDIFFSRSCRDLGLTLQVDTTVKIGHVGRYTFTWDDHRRWLLQE